MGTYEITGGAFIKKYVLLFASSVTSVMKMLLVLYFLRLKGMGIAYK